MMTRDELLRDRRATAAFRLPAITGIIEEDVTISAQLKCSRYFIAAASPSLQQMHVTRELVTMIDFDCR